MTKREETNEWLLFMVVLIIMLETLLLGAYMRSIANDIHSMRLDVENGDWKKVPVPSTPEK